MVSDVVEVVARFAGTIVDVKHVGPTSTYRIGTAPDVDLAVAGLTSFPIVEAGRVRCPVGMETHAHGATTELRAGAITLHLTRMKLTRSAVPRRRFDLRTPAFVLASLITHLALWLAAERLAPFERIDSEHPRLRLARLASPPAPVPPPPVADTQPPPRAHAKAASVQPARNDRAAVVAREIRADRLRAEEAVRAVAKSFDDTQVVARVGELTAEDAYVEDDANAHGFGGGRRFDPSQREGWGTIETGAYATMIYDVKLCPKQSCDVVGPIPALYVRTHLHAHMDAIYDCYATHASGPGTIVLEFTITGDGAVRDARGSGLGETGACAARVVGEIFFKALERETRVKYPVKFN
jgi:hypothetical protein